MCAGLAGCASLNSSKSTTPAATATQTEPDEVEYGNFSEQDDTLYDLLVAEVAAQRDQFNITLVNYIHQARATRDPGVILRAINAAQIAKDDEAIKELALIWLESEPDNIAAHQILAYQYSREKAFPEAIDQIAEILELGGETSVEALAIGSQTATEREKQELLNLYTQLLERFPDKWDVRYSLALVQRNMQLCTESIQNLNQVIAERPEFQQAYVVKANCLNESNQKKEALAYTADAYDDFPENHALGRLYASLLIESGQIKQAEDVFARLLEHYPESPSLVLSHALIMVENGKVTEAKREFDKLLELDTHKSDARYYLARIAEQEEDIDGAIEQYKQVLDGTHFETSVERATYLLSQEDRLDEALEWLEILRQDKPKLAARLWMLEYRLLNTLEKNDKGLSSLNTALQSFPNDEQLLYARAMHYDSVNNLPAMEADLRHIIQLNPQNAIALNALGYTLADKTDRYQEALTLITAALTLKPDNPAIMDSMGWILYKVGEHEKALEILAVAYQNYPDGEVAAHLGEVLWVNDKKQDALKIWAIALKKQPGHPVLVSTIERLAPEFIEQHHQEESKTDTQETDSSATDESAD